MKRKAIHRLKVMSGFEKLDAILTGFLVGDVHVVCGEPGVGKSTFAYSIARNLVFKANPPISLAFVSLGQTPEMIALKFLCAEVEIPFVNITNGNIMREDWPKLTGAAGRLADSPIYINYSNVTSIHSLITEVSNMLVNKPNISLLIIDSLQNLVPQDEALISECLRNLKAAAVELRLPVIITSSINIKPDSMDKELIVADPIYNVITKYSDVVLILRKDGYDRSLPSKKESHYCRGEDASMSRIKTELIIAKNPNGLTGSVFLDHLPQCGCLHDFDERPQSDKVEWSDAY